MLATASTTSRDPTNVGQLKKLYTTSCLLVMSWSSSSISTTLEVPTSNQLHEDHARMESVLPGMAARSSTSRTKISRQLLQRLLRADLQMTFFNHIVSNDRFPQKAIRSRRLRYSETIDLNVGKGISFLYLRPSDEVASERNVTDVLLRHALKLAHHGMHSSRLSRPWNSRNVYREKELVICEFSWRITKTTYTHNHHYLPPQAPPQTSAPSGIHHHDKEEPRAWKPHGVRA